MANGLADLEIVLAVMDGKAMSLVMFDEGRHPMCAIAVEKVGEDGLVGNVHDSDTLDH